MRKSLNFIEREKINDLIQKQKYNYKILSQSEISDFNSGRKNRSSLKNSILIKDLINQKEKKINQKNFYKKNNSQKFLYKNNNKQKKLTLKKLKYEIEIYNQNQKYSPTEFYEESINFNPSFFYRKIYKNYTLQNNNNIYKNIKSRFKNYNSTNNIFLSKRNSNFNKINQIYNSSKNLTLKLNNSINFSNSEKKIKYKSNFNINNIKNDLKSFDNKFKFFNIKREKNSINEKNILNFHYSKTKFNLDSNSRKILKKIINEIKFNDNQTNKNFEIKNFSLYYLLNQKKQKKNFIEISKEIMKIKRKFKGNDFFIPKNMENHIKKMIFSYSNDKKYFENLPNLKKTLILLRPDIKRRTDFRIKELHQSALIKKNKNIII